MQSEEDNPRGMPLATSKKIIVIFQKQNLSNNIHSNAKVTFKNSRKPDTKFVKKKVNIKHVCHVHFHKKTKMVVKLTCNATLI